MDMDEIKKHWDSNAKKYQTKLNSTTKTSTIKRLEIDAFSRVIEMFGEPDGRKSVLEVGCGNGHNLFGLVGHFPNFTFHGIDYSVDMIVAARETNGDLAHDQISFGVGDALNLGTAEMPEPPFDFVLTNRLLINLNAWELQKSALEHLRGVVAKGGFLISIENFEGSYGNQNLLRESIGLPPRVPDQYNKFMKEDQFEAFISQELGMTLIHSENFASLHDLILYVLIPHMNDGKVDYGNPAMESVTALLESLPGDIQNSFGSFGQNRLYVFKV